jgi:hypothetical protein
MPFHGFSVDLRAGVDEGAWEYRGDQAKPALELGMGLSRTLLAPGVERCFEGNRLAKDHQAQGYEAVFPLTACRGRPATPRVEMDDDHEQEAECVCQRKGVAA